MNSAPNHKFKVCIIGDSVGKSTWIRRLKGLPVRVDEVPTRGVSFTDLSIQRLKGYVQLDLWDCGGTLQGLRDGYWIGAHGAIFMCDTSNIRSIKNLSTWIRDFKRVSDTAPFIVIAINRSTNKPSLTATRSFAKLDCPISYVDNFTDVYEPLARLIPEMIVAATVERSSSFIERNGVSHLF